MEYTGDPLARVKYRFNEHLAFCGECEFDPSAKNYGLCDVGFSIHMQVRSIEAERKVNRSRRPEMTGGIGDQGEGKRKFLDREVEINPSKVFDHLFREWPLESLLPKLWYYRAHRITSNHHLLINAEMQKRIGVKCILIDLALCSKHTKETRRDWLESTIALELMWEVI